MRRGRSLRVRLALTYAGMALLTAVILGGILLAVLGTYYSRAEDAYLRASAEVVAADPPPLTTTAELTAWARTAALATQTRVRIVDGSGALVVDSGSPGDISAGDLLYRGDGHGRHDDDDRLPDPLGRGLFGGLGGSRSERTLSLPIDGAGGAYVEISEGPASGRDALLSAAQAWLVAAVLAVVLAALAGRFVAGRIAMPVVALTAASDRMAEGDLGARAAVDRDDEVGRLAESFNDMAQRIETTVTALRRFVADAAHEIGTLLTALQADLEPAQRAANSDEERLYVDRALDQMRRLEALSSGLLQLSRLEAGEAPSPSLPVDVTRLAREAADGVASRAEQAGVDLGLDIDAGPLPVAAAPAELQTVLANLLDNAIKFTPEGGRVTLAVHAAGGAALVRVADTGVGIPAEEQPGVFSRFHRGRTVSG
jgi:signal transduction histidine kinase